MGTQAEYLEHINTTLLSIAPDLYGLHENADITTNQNEGKVFLDTLLSIQPRSGGGGGRSSEDIMLEMATNLLQKVPVKFDLDIIKHKYPTLYEESINTVLLQESEKYNNLTKVMRDSLPEFLLALAGKKAMTDPLEDIGASLLVNKVPAMWVAKSFLSIKPLTSWFDDLQKRVEFFIDWIEKGKPSIFWVSGFMFPQSFFTAVKQN